jgi:16S rRNA (uracil1498-N3)-methyltransferase
MRRVLVDALHGAPGDPVALDAGRDHHLRHVLRATNGALFEAFDGRGLRAVACFQDGALVLRDAPTADRPEHALVLVLALAKGPAVDQAVRAATEVGATEVRLVTTQRSMHETGRLDRLERIAESAATQCGRADVPRITGPRPLRETVEKTRSEMPVYVATPGASPVAERPAGPCAAVVGPEGGLTAAEHAWLFDHGALAIGLTPHILRVETAAPIVLAQLTVAAR